ncbi:hypothetical protein EON66_01700, partial [archaeon]
MLAACNGTARHAAASTPASPDARFASLCDWIGDAAHGLLDEAQHWDGVEACQVWVASLSGAQCERVLHTVPAILVASLLSHPHSCTLKDVHTTLSASAHLILHHFGARRWDWPPAPRHATAVARAAFDIVQRVLAHPLAPSCTRERALLLLRELVASRASGQFSGAPQGAARGAQLWDDARAAAFVLSTRPLHAEEEREQDEGAAQLPAFDEAHTFVYAALARGLFSALLLRTCTVDARALVQLVHSAAILPHAHGRARADGVSTEGPMDAHNALASIVLSAPAEWSDVYASLPPHVRLLLMRALCASRATLLALPPSSWRALVAHEIHLSASKDDEDGEDGEDGDGDDGDESSRGPASLPPTLRLLCTLLVAYWRRTTVDEAAHTLLLCRTAPALAALMLAYVDVAFQLPDILVAASPAARARLLHCLVCELPATTSIGTGHVQPAACAAVLHAALSQLHTLVPLSSLHTAAVAGQSASVALLWMLARATFTGSSMAHRAVEQGLTLPPLVMRAHVPLLFGLITAAVSWIALRSPTAVQTALPAAADLVERLQVIVHTAYTALSEARGSGIAGTPLDESAHLLLGDWTHAFLRTLWRPVWSALAAAIVHGPTLASFLSLTAVPPATHLFVHPATPEHGEAGFRIPVLARMAMCDALLQVSVASSPRRCVWHDDGPPAAVYIPLAIAVTNMLSRLARTSVAESVALDMFAIDATSTPRDAVSAFEDWGLRGAQEVLTPAVLTTLQQALRIPPQANGSSSIAVSVQHETIVHAAWLRACGLPLVALHARDGEDDDTMTQVPGTHTTVAGESSSLDECDHELLLHVCRWLPLPAACGSLREEELVNDDFEVYLDPALAALLWLHATHPDAASHCPVSLMHRACFRALTVRRVVFDVPSAAHGEEGTALAAAHSVMCSLFTDGILHAVCPCAVPAPETGPIASAAASSRLAFTLAPPLGSLARLKPDPEASNVTLLRAADTPASLNERGQAFAHAFRAYAATHMRATLTALYKAHGAGARWHLATSLAAVRDSCEAWRAASNESMTFNAVVPEPAVRLAQSGVSVLLPVSCEAGESSIAVTCLALSRALLQHVQTGALSSADMLHFCDTLHAALLLVEHHVRTSHSLLYLRDAAATHARGVRDGDAARLWFVCGLDTGLWEAPPATPTSTCRAPAPSDQSS